MSEPTFDHKTADPFISADRILLRPVERLLATHDGTEGAGYSIFGIELQGGLVLNLSSPDEPYRRDRTTSEVRPCHDLIDVPVSSGAYLGMKLTNLIYFEDQVGDRVHRHHFAVLDSGSYLTSYTSFNYTEFALADFRDWEPRTQSRLALGPFELRSKRFHNAWNHTRIDPFELYR